MGFLSFNYMNPNYIYDKLCVIYVVEVYVICLLRKFHYMYPIKLFNSI